MSATSNYDIVVDVRGLSDLKALEQYTQKYSSALAAAQRQTSSFGKGLSGQTRAQISNFSNQIADLSIQFQGGVDPARALGQQLPQLLAGFGAIGAVLGTGAALLAPYIGQWVDLNAVFRTTTGTVKSAADAFEAATKSQKEANLTAEELQKTYGTFAGTVAQLNQELADLDRTAALKSLSTTADALITKFANVTYEAQAVGTALDEIATVGNAIARTDLAGGLAEKLGLSAVEAEKLSTALQDLRSGVNIDESVEVLGQFATELRRGDAEAQALARTLIELIKRYAEHDAAANNSITALFNWGVEAAGLTKYLEYLTGAITGVTEAAPGLISSAAAMADRVKNLIDPTRELSQDLETLKLAYELGYLSQEEFAAGTLKLREAFNAPGAKEAAAEYQSFISTIEAGATPLDQAKNNLAEFTAQYERFKATLSPEQNAAAQEQIDQLNQKIEELTFRERWDEMAKGISNVQTPLMEFAASVNELADTIANNLAAGVTDAFMAFVEGSASAEEAFKQFAVEALKQITALIVKMTALLAIKTALGALPGGGVLSKLLGFADGGVFSAGREIKAFANGGIVNGPTMFSMAGGQTGLMGEAGPEAIVPLTRRGGKLGVEASPVNVTVINQAGARVTTSREPDGGIRILVQKEVATALARGGNEIDAAMRAGYGLRRVGR